LATVITNLISAIPWIGQDIVELIWGGLYTDEPYNREIILKILLNAGKFSNFVVTYVLFLFLLIEYVKIVISRRQSAGVCNKSLSTLQASQRLHAGDLIYAYLVGLIEGDGYFSISKKGKYLTYELGIELSIRDVQLIYKIKRILGIGIVSFREKNGKKMVSLKIRNKDHLKKYILPIFDKYPMLSKKQYDYIWFKDCLIKDIIYSKDLIQYTRSNENINSVKSILNTSYFSTWLVGFIEAEGSFSIYKLNKDMDYLIASFEISQTNEEILIDAIKIYLCFTTSIYLDKNNNNFKLKATGVRSIENIIKFLKRAPVKLLGYKRLQYLLWIKELRKISRYSDKIKIPLNY
jgi:LAGLIDADG endonuclease